MTAPLPDISLTWWDQNLVPEGHGSLWWPERKTLIVADLHLGKVGHFRKAGIALPQQALSATMDRLDAALTRWQPTRLLVLGDMFHSDYNRELGAFGAWRERWQSLHVALVPGNHDVLSAERYAAWDIELLPLRYREAGLWFVHDPADAKGEEGHIAGHLHPGVRLRGGGRQSLRLPCFWFGQNRALLPACGAFTGSVALQPKPGERAFAWTGTAVVDVSPEAKKKDAERSAKDQL